MRLPNDDFRIHYFEGSGTTWSWRALYHGFVLAVAWDTTGSYLLYVDFASRELRITKRLADGTYTGGRRLAPRQWLDSNLSQVTWSPPAASGGRCGASTSPPTAASPTRPAERPVPGLHHRGFTNSRPDVQVAGTTTYVTWHRDGHTVVADNGSGSFVSHTFRTAAASNFDYSPPGT